VTLGEQKIAEEKLAKLLGDLTSAEKAVLYKPSTPKGYGSPRAMP